MARAPRIGDFTTYRSWVAKAARELDRFRKIDDVDARIDHAINFALASHHACEWAHDEIIKGSGEWPLHQELGAFRTWIAGRCQDTQWVRSIAEGAKHRELHNTSPKISEVTTSATSFWGPLWFSSEPHDLAIVGMEAGDGRLAYVHAIAVKVVTPEGRKRFEKIARSVLAFWESFDPAKGPRQ